MRLRKNGPGSYFTGVDACLRFFVKTEDGHLQDELVNVHHGDVVELRDERGTALVVEFTCPSWTPALGKGLESALAAMDRRWRKVYGGQQEG